MLVPTVVFGLTPARGGFGEVTRPDVFRRMLDDIEAAALYGQIDLIITGHFSDPEQVEIAAGLIDRVRSARRSDEAGPWPWVLVDPVLGDSPKGLYVRPDVADRIRRLLVPAADWITPNLWELGFLADRPITTLEEVRDAALQLGKPALVTSAPAGPDEIGLLYVDKADAILFAHPRVADAPKGTGDLVTASFGAGLVEGRDPRDAAERTARAALEIVLAADLRKSTELPIVAVADRLVNPNARVRIEAL